MRHASSQLSLCLDAVGSLEHVVDVLQVVGSVHDGADIASGGKVLLEVGLLAHLAHLGIRNVSRCRTIS